jgi:hypothetical protein
VGTDAGEPDGGSDERAHEKGAGSGMRLLSLHRASWSGE